MGALKFTPTPSISTMAPPSRAGRRTSHGAAATGQPTQTGSGSALKKKPQQNTLFSFFAKKTESVAPPASQSNRSAASTNINGQDQNSRHLPPSSSSSQLESPPDRLETVTHSPPASSSFSTSQEQPKTLELPPPPSIGARIEVWWPKDEQYYVATVLKHCPSYPTGRQASDTASLQVQVRYEQDDQVEWIPLGQETWRSVEPQKGDEKTKDEPERKKRRLQVAQTYDDDDDEEMEFQDDDDDDDDESAYAENEAEVEEVDDDQWLVSDDEEEEDDGSRVRRNKKTGQGLRRLSKSTQRTAQVTEVRESHTRPSTSSSSSTSSSLSRKKTPQRPTSHSDSTLTPAGRTPHQVTPSLSALAAGHRGGDRLAFQTPPASAKAPTRPSLSADRGTANSTGPIPFVKDAINPPGSHVHHHLQFLRSPRDAQGRPRDHADYNPRTLWVDEAEWAKLMDGKKMTHAVQQWWDLKAQYYDAVLLFKTGKFYEMFHMDADVGVQVLGLQYMKGHVAHAGFPEKSYGTMADQLVRAGYKVARVEQTETPEQLQERKKKQPRGGGGGAPKVVNREVCSIMTSGTRTFCYLDDDRGLAEEMTSGSGQAVGVGPLLAIREVLLLGPEKNDDVNCDDEEDETVVRPVCEYGIALVDAVRGSVTLGQFADDVLRSRMDTLFATFTPSEVLLYGGEHGTSPTLMSLIKSLQTASSTSFRVEFICESETFPKSTALEASVRRKLDRGSPQDRWNTVHPWDVEETLKELHNREYYPKASKRNDGGINSTSRWPAVLRAAVEGRADLALSSFGAALFYLQRNLIDGEILSMGIIKAYVPPTSITKNTSDGGEISKLASQQCLDEAGVDHHRSTVLEGSQHLAREPDVTASVDEEAEVNHMSLDGTTLQNLEVLTNNTDFKTNGSLWARIDFTKTPHGSRLLRAWLLRPLFRKADIERRADAVQELASGAAALALAEATSQLSKCGDIERLLSRVHSMSGSCSHDQEETARIHPNERAVLYETETYTKRKVGDFSKVLNGLRYASKIPELFQEIDIQSGLLKKVVRRIEDEGCFPDMGGELDWFFSNFDCEQAAKGMFEPSRGIDVTYDEACESIECVESALKDYKDEMCTSVLRPSTVAKTSWKYINTKPESKDKYLIELPISVKVPDYFILKGKRGSGMKQINKYRTADVEALVQELETALDVQKERKARGMQLIFAKFDAKRTLWAAASHATAMLDALGSLATASSRPGYSRPIILPCNPGECPTINVTQGRHPCVESSLSSKEFVPNDLSLGGGDTENPRARVLLLSGPNMGGKSTLLRQTCLIAILAQIGAYVPADACELTPIDRIYTRLGASDRILLGQSTFFVELAETAAALRGATRRSLVIMDELGRGTSTFDGTAIASATVKYLVDRSQCLSLFATHYHSLLDEWKDNTFVRLGHMECLVETIQATDSAAGDDKKITFLYTLGDGVCPKSFGINVARLAGLPPEVLTNAKRISSDFEEEMTSESRWKKLTARNAIDCKRQILEAMNLGDWQALSQIWQNLNGRDH